MRRGCAEKSKIRHCQTVCPLVSERQEGKSAPLNHTKQETALTLFCLLRVVSWIVNTSILRSLQMPPTTAENPRLRTSKHVRQPNRISKYIYRVAAAPDARLSSVSFRRARARAAAKAHHGLRSRVCSLRHRF